jgi:hypothetical protein
MITQSFKRWLHKMFAWWPWRQSLPMEYKHASGPLSQGTAEGVSLSTIDGTAPQITVTPRLSTIEERPERILQTPFPAASDLSLPPPVAPPADIPGEPIKEDILPAVPSAPTLEQRLEFMRYLVKRGIVNEGFEKK